MTANPTVSEDTWTARLTPSDVHNVLFSRAGLGRRGYDEGEVDFFLERVQNELARLIAEKADMREEADRLRNRVHSDEGDNRPRRDEASAQSVRILTAAQQTADQYVAEAENYSRRLSVEAREHAEKLIDDARERAQAILEQAEQDAAELVAAAQLSLDQDTEDGISSDDSLQAEPIKTEQAKQELEAQVAYLRTFSEVCRVQLRAYLEALLRDIEDEWGRAQPEVLAALPRRREDSDRHEWQQLSSVDPDMTSRELIDLSNSDERLVSEDEQSAPTTERDVARSL